MTKRLYFSSTQSAPIDTVSFSLADWQDGINDQFDFTQASRFLLRSFKGSTTTQSGSVHTWQSYNSDPVVNDWVHILDRQFISGPMDQQVIWRDPINNSDSPYYVEDANNYSAVSGMMSVRSFNGNDELEEIYTRIYVVSNDGQTFRGTLMSPDFWNDTSDIFPSGDFKSQYLFWNNDLEFDSGEDYLFVHSGDRMVVEIAYGGFMHPAQEVQGAGVFGDADPDLDFTEDFTVDTFIGVGRSPWLDFYQDIQFLDNLDLIGTSTSSCDCSADVRIISDNIQYNVYYGLTIDGPWTKANVFPILNNPTGHEFTIQGLANERLYYIMVVGGYLDADGTFRPQAGQPIILTPEPGKDIINPNMVAAKPSNTL